MSVLVKARSRTRRAQAAAEIARVGTSPVSLLGRVVVTALVIAGVQRAVITHADDDGLIWAALALPALVTAYTITKALTLVTVAPSARRTRERR
ncbi:hypothetical protein BJF78_00210 [Pseudonocardia sp. CNS-139]|nr:hypothetical protein BJF78_00210 [Pseudonocardia sp. CNS-139]